MMTAFKFALRAIMIALLVVWLTPPASAQIGKSLEFADKQPLSIRAESLTYFAADHLFVAEGDVEITYREARLTADYVEFHEDTAEALAIGHVIYEEGVETLTADRAEFNLEDATGTMTQGNLSLADDQYFTGRAIIKTGEKTYTIKHGSFTACDSARPAWKFRSTTAYVEQDEYLQSWHTVGYVKGIPIFYLPYFVFPIKQDRQSGMLIPDIGNSSKNGFKISNAFFWAITDSQDATFRHTYYDLRGHKYDLEYRYKYSNDTEGNALLEYFYKDRIDSKTKRSFEWTHSQELGYKIKGRVQIEYTDDDQFDKDFSDVIDEQSNTYLESEVSLTRNFSQHSVKLLFDRLDDLRDGSNDRSDQRFPEVTFSSQNQQIFGSPLYFRQITQAARLKREGKVDEYLDVNRLDLNPVLSMPFNLGGALTLNPELELRETYYSKFTTQEQQGSNTAEKEHDAVHREYYAARLNMTGPRIHRIFDFGKTRRTQKMKHLIEPNLSYQYVPGIDEKELPKFDGIDRLASEKKSQTLSYGITQRLLTKRVLRQEWEKFLRDEEGDLYIEDLTMETYDIASFVLSQSYNIEAEEYNFSDLSATMSVQPFEGYQLRLNTAYDMYVKTLVSSSIDVNWDFWDAWMFDVKWRRNVTVDRDEEEVKDVKQFVDFDTSLLLFSTLKLTYRGRFDITEDERIEDAFGLIYNGQCWNLSGTYVQQLLTEERESTFRILLEIKHIGKLLDLKGSSEEE